MKIIHNFTEDFKLNQEYNVFYLDDPKDMKQVEIFKKNLDFITTLELDRVDMIYYDAKMVVAIYDDVYKKFLEVVD